MEQQQLNNSNNTPFLNGSDLFNKRKRNKPLKSGEEKNLLIPAFLHMTGFISQHVNSFDQFLLQDIHNIIHTKSNNRVLSDVDPNFYLQYNLIRVKKPKWNNQSTLSMNKLYPAQCRLRDMTYSGSIIVDVEFVHNNQRYIKDNIKIGEIPLMLGCAKCHLKGASAQKLARLGECPYDPKGYFIVNGTEKALLMQEQMAKNRIIIEHDRKINSILATVASSTLETKSKAAVLTKNGKLYLKANSFTELLPIFVVFKAFKIENDLQVFNLVGDEQNMIDCLSLSLQDTIMSSVYNQQQALQYISSRVRVSKFHADRGGGRQGGKSEQAMLNDARDILTNVLFAHIPCQQYDYFPKAVFLALMVRRVLEAENDSTKIDDKDYYGNKRLECAGQLMALLFEDKFKTFNAELKKEIDKHLAKQKGVQSNKYGQSHNQAVGFDFTMFMERSHIITNGMSTAVKTGNWSLKRFKMERLGVTQVLSRLTYIGCLGMLTRISSQFEKTRKISGPRALQGSHFGIICPSDTPDGESCGLVKNLALLAQISLEEPSERILKLAIQMGVEDIALVSTQHLLNNYSSKRRQQQFQTDNIYDIDFEKKNLIQIHQISSSYIVFLNGQIIGLHAYPDNFVKEFRLLRRKCILPSKISIHKDIKHRCIVIASDYGRLCRPLIIVENNTSLVTNKHIDMLKQKQIDISYFIQKGLIEYLDVNEQDDVMIALTEEELALARNDSASKIEYTHLEISQLAVLGVVAGLIPFPHHNQSPRNTYQCAMGKQAIGTLAHNQLHRVDVVDYVMVYPQTPLVKTETIDLVGYDQLPAGHNAIIAVMSYSGYDIEDAVILNKASLDRGFGRILVYRRNNTTFKKYSEDVMDAIRVISIPKLPENASPKDRRQADNMYKKYHALDKEGIAKIGSLLNTGDVYINKGIPDVPSTSAKQQLFVRQSANSSQHESAANVQIKWTDNAQTHKGGTPAYVDRQILTSTDEYFMMIKTVLRETRRPELGDKFSSRHGQKGVCGLIVSQQDMPFSEQGVCPDLIMNPHGYPSRMTVGKMIELISGKAGALQGEYKYGTAFSGEKVDHMGQELALNGFSYAGKECLISGVTGEYLNCYVFTGPCFYQRLKHMVADKCHARARGPTTILTRQPTEGRSRDGGLRLGEMERDCLIGHGASNLLLERLSISSDVYNVFVCDNCGLFQYKRYCEGCKTDKVYNIKLPYACKLLFQELLSMNIKPKINLEDIN